MDSLLFTLNAVLPIIACILIGYFIKRLKIFPDNFWGTLNKLTFKLFLPVLLFKNIYDIDDIGAVGNYWKVILFCAVTTIVVFFIGLIFVKFCIKEDKQKGVILQCIFRSNYAIIGIGLIELLANGNEMAKGIGAVISAVSIPIFNILAIISLSIFVKSEDGKKPSPKQIFIKICKNPLIIGVLTGLIFLSIKSLILNNTSALEEEVFLQYEGCEFLYTTIKWLAQCASPVALVALGGGFVFSAISRLKFQIIIGTVARTIIVPVLALIVAYLLGFGNDSYFPALIALFGTPVAVSSAPMAQEMDNDGELAGQLVVWCSIVSVITLTLIILVCSLMGII
ncbi:MAG: AEC family transporter [Acholeplasmatales bacterium]|nr:AEC family transporter [Acholeplasmatales bacterium]